MGIEPIEQKELTVEKLSAAIEIAINNKQIRDRAVALGKQIRSENGVDNAVKTIVFIPSLDRCDVNS